MDINEKIEIINSRIENINFHIEQLNISIGAGNIWPEDKESPQDIITILNQKKMALEAERDSLDQI